LENVEIPKDWENIIMWSRKWAPTQRQIIGAFENKYVILLVAANGVGKTLLLCWNFIALMLGIHPIQKPRDDNGKTIYAGQMAPPLKARISAPTWDHNVMNVIVPMVKSLLPKSMVKRDFTESNRTWTLKNGSSLECMTYEQMVSQHASRELDLVGHDEQPPRQIWIEDMERLRSAKNGGRNMICMTQELESARPIDWMLEDLWEKDSDDIGKFTMSKYDLMGYHPNYTKEYFEREKRKYGEGSDEYKVKILGQFISLGGLVYGSHFKDLHQPTGHLIRYFSPTQSWDFGMALDSHPRKPVAGLWYAKDADGNIFVIDELKRAETEGKTLREVCEIIKIKERGWNVAVRLIGESATAKDNRIRPDWSDQEEFAKWGIFCQPAQEKPLNSRINAVTQYLKSDGSDYPEIRIFEHCHDLRHDLKHVVYEEYKHKEEKDPKMKVKDKWKCLPDCLSYICQYEGRFVDSEPEESVIDTDILPRFHWGKGLSTGSY
jgi:phage terminase large subunit-like protein